MFLGLRARAEFWRARSKSKAAGEGARSTLLRRGFARGGVVAGAALHSVALFGFHFEFAVAAVERGVGGCVAEVVLAAEFGGDLVEGFLQLVEFVADVDDAASGGLGEFAHLTLAGIAHLERSVEAAIGAEQHIDD